MESVIAARLDGIEGVATCGTVQADADRLELAAIRKCALDAVHEGQPFSAILYRQGTDSIVATGFVWDGKGPIVELSYDSDPSGGSGAGSRVSEVACSELTETESCSDDPETPCLVCERSGEWMEVCRGPRGI